MAEKYDGWIAKDKFGDFWLGTFKHRKRDVKSSIECNWAKQYNFEIVKVKFVEVK